MILEWDHKRYLFEFLAIEHGNFLETAWLRYDPSLLLSYHCMLSFLYFRILAASWILLEEGDFTI
ncbi:hypothetical protein LguiA_025646 [Lonicera macranthoides]